MNDKNFIIKRLSRELDCNESSIKEIILIQNPSCNVNYFFKINDKKYVYRDSKSVVLQRVTLLREYAVQNIASLHGMAPQLVAFDVDEGWKISEYAEGHTLDYDNESECRLAMEFLREMHTLPVNIRATKCIKDWWNFRIASMNEETKTQLLSDKQYLEIYKTINQLWDVAGCQNNKCLVHGDFRNSNIIVGRSGIVLIDWEYANFDDPGLDFGAFICGGNFSSDGVYSLIECYLGKKPERSDLLHYYAYIAFYSFYKYVATSFLLSYETREPVISMHKWLKEKSLEYAEIYSRKALDLIR